MALRALLAIRNLRPEGGPNQTNILLFGEPGLGKSSLTATLARAFDVSAVVPDVVPPLTTTGNSSHTRNSVFYHLSGTNIRIRDIWGWREAQKNFEPTDLRIIMMGSAADGVKERSESAPIAFQPSRKDLEIDGVIFFLPNLDFAAAPQKFVAIWKELLPFVNVVRELKKPYVFVINKLDEIDVGGTTLMKRGATTLGDLQLNTNWTNIAGAVMGVMGSGASPPLPLVCYLSTELAVSGPSFNKLQDVEEFALNVLLRLLQDNGGSSGGHTIYPPPAVVLDMFKYERPQQIAITTADHW